MGMTGLCFININGRRVRSKEGANMKPGGLIQEPVNDANGYCGMANKENKNSEVKFIIPHSSEDDVTALQAMKDATLVFETDSGQRYLIRDAGTIGEVDFKGKEVDITMGGAPAELM
ncbi:phage tail tube protein [Paludibacterium denitrificans]|uniref:Uncharacterized protein n=1 Tax=Paludibacterium denitrificans TaxID=2675226 RepID=A0A844GAN6_9NEIS|nr:phage tail tube protein [Paludibacterium denitrificans]MTD32410.1 hypothetical protein [Paludibacterium denitrificans]